MFLEHNNLHTHIIHHYLTAMAGYVFQGCVSERERERERKLGQRPIEMSFHSTVYPSEQDVYAL